MPKLETGIGFYLGIDPGASGGLVCLGLRTNAMPMPKTERDVWGWFEPFQDMYRPPQVFAVLEKVGGYAGEGQPGSAMFKFGRGVGVLIGCLMAAGIPFEEVTPQAWQKALGCGNRKKGESKTSWKNRLKAKAQQLFPKIKVTLAIADALLIAEYCKRKREGTL